MNLTVDASVVVKWFVAEPMYDKARLVLGRRIQTRAPELLLAEFTNTIWKKVRRKEVSDAGPYLDELAALRDIIVLCPVGDLIERAARIAFELDHPVYDCLYLACAETTDSDLITADRRLADKAADRLPGTRVRYLGASGVADWLETAATAPVIGQDTIEALIAAYDVFAKTEQSVLEALFSGNEVLRITSHEHRKVYMNSPSYRRLVDSIRKLDDEAHIDLLALGWFGARRFPDWQGSFEHAEEMVAIVDPEYAINYGRHWQAGYARMSGG